MFQGVGGTVRGDVIDASASTKKREQQLPNESTWSVDSLRLDRCFYNLHLVCLLASAVAVVDVTRDRGDVSSAQLLWQLMRLFALRKGGDIGVDLKILITKSENTHV